MADKAATADNEVQTDEHMDRCSELEKQMLSLPAVTAADFAAKLIANTHYGDYGLDEFDNISLLKEAMTLVGRGGGDL